MLDLIRTALRGLRARRLLSAGSIMLTALAIGSAVLAPIFSSAVIRSYGITRLATTPATLTGLSFVLHPTAAAVQDPRALQDRAVRDIGRRTGAEFHRPRPLLESDDFAALGGRGRLVAGDGVCRALEIEGACPRTTAGGPVEVLLARVDLEKNDLAIGDTVHLGGQASRVSFGTARIVGSYRAPPVDDFWFDLRRLASTPSYLNTMTREMTPYLPAPIITDPAVFKGFPAATWHVLLDSRLGVDTGWTGAERQAAADTAERLDELRLKTGDGMLEADSINELRSIDDDVRAQEGAARSSIAPAVLSAVLVALALLLRLLLAAADARRPELALASLRGVSRRRMWVLGLTEPLIILLVATPLGVLFAAGTAVLLVRSWLLPGLSVPLPWTSVAAGLAVLLLALVISVLSVGKVLRETLADQLAGAGRPARSGRLATLVQLGLLALAGLVLVTKLGDAPGEADLTDLLLPVLLALAAGLVATRATEIVAAWWTRHHPNARFLPGFVAARALARRAEGTLVVLPLTAAIAIGVFAAGVHDSAADWRHSVAATSAPGDVVWDSPLPLDSAVALTHELDPAGEHLMAVGLLRSVETRITFLDGARLAQVVEWPDAWTPGTSKEAVAAMINAPEPLPEFSGTSLELTVDRDAVVEGELWLEVRSDVGHGIMHREYVGPFPDGTHTRGVKVPYCARSCRIRSLSVGGGAGLPTSMRGVVTMVGLEADGEPVPGAWSGWTSGKEDNHALESVDETDGRLEVRVDTGSEVGTVWLNAGGVPARVPVLAGLDSDSLLERDEKGFVVPVRRAEFPATVMLDVESLPFLGPFGLLADYTATTATRDLPEEDMTVRVLARSDTPESMQESLRDHGLSVSTTLESEQGTLDGTAYALALRLYAVVAVLVLLMALAGLVVSTAVQMPSRRRDAASLRVVGVRRGSVMGAVALEFGVVLGGAAAAGGAAGALAQYVVLRTITLGIVDDTATPRLVAAVDGQRLLLLAVVAAVVLGVVAVATAAAAVRGARGGTLREMGR